MTQVFTIVLRASSSGGTWPAVQEFDTVMLHLLQLLSQWSARTADLTSATQLKWSDKVGPGGILQRLGIVFAMFDGAIASTQCSKETFYLTGLPNQRRKAGQDNLKEDKMNYQKPEAVLSPKDHWEFIGTLYDGGEHQYSIALGRWDGDPCIACRWNGSMDSDKAKKGNPISNYQPTWFVLPGLVKEATLRQLAWMEACEQENIDSALLRQAIELLQE